MELSEIIKELEIYRETIPQSSVSHGLVATAINNLKAVTSRKLDKFRMRHDVQDMIQCGECQPGRPCYGHGHY